MFRFTSVALGLVFLFGTVVVAGPVAAQDATVTTGAADAPLASPPVAPDPAECRVEPRPADYFDQLTAPADAAATGQAWRRSS